jgi:hypothetical protein
MTARVSLPRSRSAPRSSPVSGSHRTYPDGMRLTAAHKLARRDLLLMPIPAAAQHGDQRHSPDGGDHRARDQQSQAGEPQPGRQCRDPIAHQGSRVTASPRTDSTQLPKGRGHFHRLPRHAGPRSPQLTYKRTSAPGSQESRRAQVLGPAWHQSSTASCSSRPVGMPVSSSRTRNSRRSAALTVAPVLTSRPRVRS